MKDFAPTIGVSSACGHAGRACRAPGLGMPRTGSTRIGRSTTFTLVCRTGFVEKASSAGGLVAGAFVFSGGLGLVATNCINAFSYG
jgi:hypothetical protein